MIGEICMNSLDPFSADLNIPITSCTFGELCNLLVRSNISIYQYENLKWHKRNANDGNAKQRDAWDYRSRRWNEKRSAIKNRIDILLQQMMGERKKKPSKNISYPHHVLPISHLIDMLTIENIKIYDRTMKGDKKGKLVSAKKSKALREYIDAVIKDISVSGAFPAEPETRTF